MKRFITFTIDFLIYIAEFGKCNCLNILTTRATATPTNFTIHSCQP